MTVATLLSGWFCIAGAMLVVTAALAAGAPETPEIKTSTEKPASDKPAGDSPATDKPTAERAVPEKSPTDKPADESARPLLVEHNQIEYVRDPKTGALVRVINLDLTNLAKLSGDQPAGAAAAGPPPYSIQQLKITGEAGNEQAELSAELSLHITTPNNWVGVPLRFGKAARRDPTKYSGKGEYLIAPDRDGNVVWLKGEAEPRLTLSLVVPLPRREHQLELDVPQSATSELRLAVPAKISSATASGSAPPSVGKFNAGKTEIAVLDLKGGDFKLNWREAESGVSNASAALDVNSAIFVRCEQHSVKYEATITVRSLAGPFDRFRVQLPAQSQWVSGQPSSTAPAAGTTTAGTIAPSPGGTTSSAAAASDRPATPAPAAAGQGPNYTLSLLESKEIPTVEVVLDEPTTGPVKVKLSAERSYDLKAGKEGNFKVGAFVLLGAKIVKQYGSIGLAASDEMTVRWDELVSLRQVDRFPGDRPHADLVAAFEYSGIPSLTLTPAIRNTKIKVEPEYIYQVERDRVKLDAKWTYDIGRAKLNLLEFRLPDAGWEIDEVLPAELVTLEDTKQGDVYRLRPVKKSDENDDEATVLPSLSGKVAITLHAHAPLPEKAEHVTWSLPLPLDTGANAAAQLTVERAKVVVVPADNVNLMPQPAGTAFVDLKSDMDLPAAMRDQLKNLGPHQQNPLRYGVETAQLANARFSGGLMVRKQAVAVEAANQLRLWPDRRKEIEVQQQFTYRVDYVPLERIVLEIPKRLDELHAQPTFRLDGEEATPTKVVDLRDEDDPAANRRLQIEVPGGGKIGSLQLTVDYQLPQEEPAVDTPRSLALPLVIPLDGELKSNATEIVAAQEMHVDRVAPPWMPIPQIDPDSIGGDISYRADGRTAEIQLSVVLENLQTRGSTLVDRAWLQSWLGEFVRQDRAAYRFTSTQDHLELKLPAGLKSASLRVLLDGKPTGQMTLAGSRLLVSLKSLDTTLAEHTLDLLYRFDGPMLDRSRLVIDTPTFAGNVWVRRTYWQLVVPHDRHLIASPEELAPEFAWAWQGVCYNRQPLMEQTDLESWIGVAHERALPETTNRYLFSTLVTDGQFELRVVPRTAIVAAASLAALAIGLLLLYVRGLRNPAALLVLATLVAGLGLAYPELAILVAQGATLGVVLSLLAALLGRMVEQRRARLTSIRRTSPSVVERLSTELHPSAHAQPRSVGPRLGDSAATATMTLEIPASEPQA